MSGRYQESETQRDTSGLATGAVNAQSNSRKPKAVGGSCINLVKCINDRLDAFIVTQPPMQGARDDVGTGTARALRMGRRGERGGGEQAQTGMKL